MQSNLLKIFNQINNPKDLSNLKKNYYLASPIPDCPSHKVGRDFNNQPCLLISTKNIFGQIRPAPLKLENLSVNYDVNCKIYNSNKMNEEKLTVISCTSEDPILREFFFRAGELLFTLIGNNPTRDNLSTAIDKIVELFSAMNNVPKKSIQGLWAELFIIATSSNPSILINAWHKSPLDVFDFSYKNQRIEVKSSISNERKHHFSLEQLNPQQGIEVIIASVFIERLGSGLSVLDLAEIIRDKVNNNPNELYIIDRIISLTLGNQWKLTTLDHFDFQLAKKSLKFYSNVQIPTVTPNIPDTVSNVHFKSDLTNITPLNIKSTKNSKNILEALPN